MEKSDVLGDRYSKIPSHKSFKIPSEKLATDVASNSSKNVYEFDDSKTKTNVQQRGRLEDQLNYEHLQALEKIFRAAEDVSGGRLNLEEFGKAMRKLLGPHVSKRELEILFMKVDTDCDGEVDWDEYLSYMLLEYQGKAKMTSLAKEVNHSRESSLCLWVTDMAPCANVGLVAISSTEREISFYDVAGTRLERKYQIVSFKDPVLTMNYWFNHTDLNCCTLVASDSSGTVLVFRFNQVLKKGLFGNSLHKGLTRKVTVLALATQIVDEAHCLAYENLHSNLVNSAQYFQLAQGLECFISCSASDNESMYLGDLTNVVYKSSWPGFVKRTNNRGCYYKVKRGIITLDYSKQWNLIVTGSFDGVIRTWHPGSSKPITSITTHHCSVPHVVLMAGACQLIACGSDRLIKVIEIRDNTTIQALQPRIFTFMGPPAHKISAMYYQKRNKVLVLGTMQVAILEGNESETADATAVKTHDGSVSAVLYNKLFDLVITSGHDSIVSVWDFNTGSKVIQFTVLKHIEITAMSFDQTERRLIIGLRNGSISIWNFNNGACLKILTKGDGLEITGIICHKQKIIATGWNRKMNVFIDSRNDAEELDRIESSKWKEDHKEDLLCITLYQHPGGESILATCSYDGNIFIWSLESGSVICCLNKQTSFSPLTTNGITFDQAIESHKYSATSESGGRRGGVSVPASSKAKQAEKSDLNEPVSTINPRLLVQNAPISEDETSDSSYTTQTSVSDEFTDSEVTDSHNLSTTSHSSCPHLMQLPVPVPTIIVDIYGEGASSKVLLEPSQDERRKTSTCNICRRKQKKRKRKRRRRRSPSPSHSEKMEKLIERIRKHSSCSRTHSSSPDSSEKSKVSKIKKSSSQIHLLPSAGYSHTQTSNTSLHIAISHTSTGDSNSSQLKTETKQEISSVESQYRKAEVCVTQVLFLQTRPHSPNTATLIAAGGIGWVYAWSVHPQGGLLGQFVGAHTDEEVVLSMATDESNNYLFTGDSVGYVKMWKIEDYCNLDINKIKTTCDLTEIQLKTNLLTEEEMRILSSRRASKLRTTPPDIKIYFRAHINSISSISVIDGKNMFVTACVDGTVRLWTFSGIFMGTYGQKQHWNFTSPKEGPRMPNEIRRVASANTLRLLNAGYSLWNRAKKLVKLALATMRHDMETYDAEEFEPRAQILFNEMNGSKDIEEEYQRISKTLSHSKILGHSYKPTRHHRNLPKIHFKPRLNNFQVHSSLTFSSLEEMHDIPVPEVLKKKWRLQKEAAESEQRLRIKRATTSCFRTKANQLAAKGKETTINLTLKAKNANKSKTSNYK